MRIAFIKRVFLNPASTLQGSHVIAHVESSHEGEFAWGANVITIADCRKSVTLEFCIGNARARRISLAKINLFIKILIAFRDALTKEIALIEKGSKASGNH